MTAITAAVNVIHKNPTGGGKSEPSRQANNHALLWVTIEKISDVCKYDIDFRY